MCERVCLCDRSTGNFLFFFGVSEVKQAKQSTMPKIYTMLSKRTSVHTTQALAHTQTTISFPMTMKGITTINKTVVLRSLAYALTRAKCNYLAKQTNEHTQSQK